MPIFAPITRIAGTVSIAVELRMVASKLAATLPIDFTLTGAARKNGVADLRGTLPIAATLIGTATQFQSSSGSGNVSFAAFRTIGSDYAYSEGRPGFAPFGALGTSGQPEGDYAIGDTSLSLFATFGIGFTGGVGQGNVSFRPLGSVGSDYAYSAGIVALEPLGTAGEGDILPVNVISSTAIVHARYHIVLPANQIVIGSAATALKRVHVVAGSVGTVSNAVKNRIRCHIVALSRGAVESEATFRGAQGETWLFNATTYAASRVQGYFFDSLADLDGVIFGASAEGIFELVGTTDNGAPIKGSIITGRANSKLPNVKRFSYGHVYGVSVEKLTIRVADETPVVYNYETDVALGPMVSSVRFKVGKGLKMHYWQVALENQGGTYFEVDHLDLLPAVLERWVR